MIYLDNAATTFPKPRAVVSEVNRCIETYCGNPGRGSHELALASANKIYECRELLSGFIGLDKPENVIFTENTTYALNMLIKGTLGRGDHVIISDMEHNSVWRPVYDLAINHGIRYDIFKTHPADKIIPSIKRLIRPNTKMIVCAHTPNITSAVLPIGEIGELCRRHKIIFAVDGAQSAGHIPLNMKDMNIDALCLPGHKGLYGIQGCGALCLGENALPYPIFEGGNGVNSLDPTMPELPPERYETGTLPTPAIAGLAEGIKAVSELGVNKIREKDISLWHYTCESLLRIGGITVYEPTEAGSVILFNMNGIPSDRLASELGEYGICVRGGYHCAALGHKALETPLGGAVRVSFGTFNEREHIDVLAAAIKQINRSYGI